MSGFKLVEASSGDVVEDMPFVVHFVNILVADTLDFKKKKFKIFFFLKDIWQ